LSQLKLANLFIARTFLFFLSLLATDMLTWHNLTITVINRKLGSSSNMKKKSILPLLSLGLLSISFLLPASAETKAGPDAKNETPHWGYHGDSGPEHWGDLSPQFTACKTGKNQSPIDINASLLDANLPAIPFKYNMLTPSTIENNGHTVQVNMWSGGEITLDGIVFKLKQFHFHTPSENTMNGKNFPLEAHFVHQSKDGELAVVAVMYKTGKQKVSFGNCPGATEKRASIGTFQSTCRQ